jgi:hypothetical protein
MQRNHNTYHCFTLFTILSTCVSDFSSSMKVQEETTTGSMFLLSARIPMINAVNGICRLVVESVHN